MLYVILLIILGLVITPIIYLKPTPRQKQQTAMRTHAMKQGLQVKLAPLPEPTAPGSAGKASVKLAHDSGCIVYRLIRPATETEPSWRYVLGRTARDRNEWYFYPQSKRPPILMVEPLFALLAELPADAEVVESGPQMLGVYWQERGGNDAVDRLQSVLNKIQALEKKTMAGIEGVR